MKPLVLVIGGRDSGKSTIIASLTGCPSHNYRGLVKDKTSGRQIYVVTSSPQEAGLTPAKFRGILRTVSRQDLIGIVMAIQPTRPYKRLSLEKIIQGAQRKGTLSIHAFVLDPPYMRKGAIDTTVTRSRLGALGVVPHSLDGRHFAHLNATEIKAITGIPY